MTMTSNTQNKRCDVCLEPYDSTEFYIVWNGKINLFTTCNKCRNKQRRQKHKELSEINVPKTIASTISSRIKREISRHTPFQLERQGYFQFLPYSLEELKSHLEEKFQNWMQWYNWGKYVPKYWNDDNSETWKWQIDHIIPCANFSYESVHDKEFYACWSLDNLRPLSAKQNVLEGTKKTRI